METIKVKLSRKYEAPGAAPFDTLEIRPPTYAEIFMSALGRPFEFHPTRGGTMLMRDPVAVDQYVQRLLVSPGYEFIHGISARDAGRLEDAICGFFLELPEPTKPPAGSSSGTASELSISSE